jgi:uncharacterized protein YybS (DUF2232 family)
MVEDNNEARARAIIEGIRLVGVTIFLALFSMILPGVGLALACLIPAPIALCVARHDLKLGIVASLAAGLMVAAVGSPLYSCLLVIGFGLTGVAIGESIRANFSLKQTLVYSTLAALLSKVLFVVVVWFLMQEEVSMILGVILEQLQETFVALEIPYDIKFEEILNFFIFMIPGFAIGTCILEAVVNYSLVAAILRKLGVSIKSLPPFSLWRFPPLLVFGYAIGCGMMILNVYYPNIVLSLVGLNLITLISQVFFIQGLSFGWFLADRWKLHKVVRWIIAVFSILMGVFSILVFVGVFDSLLNLRRFFPYTGSRK